MDSKKNRATWYRKVSQFHVMALCLFCLPLISITAQEALLSTAENYYEFLSLTGDTERPYLNYRTLSDSTWSLTGEGANIWSGNNLGTTRTISDSVRFRVYGPELFSSYNSAQPYGQNDGALWQGKGLNTSLTGGARIEAYGFEITIKPQISYSQNRSYDIVAPAYSAAAYAGKADTYGYYGITWIDAPQRFGNDPVYNFSWGDSEVRYSWKTLTVGFGTQSIWLGPANINPILHSNNAAPYPKLDLGLRRQTVSVFDHDLGDIESRIWWGRTTESDFFDNNSSNDHNLITGLTFSYAPSFPRGLTLGFHRTMLSKWNSMNASSIFTLIVPKMSSDAGRDENDQRASLTASYVIPSVGFEIYAEWARNDYSPSKDYILRYPFHTQAYTIGLSKAFTISPGSLKGLVAFELTNLESSRDYEIIATGTTFYAHHKILQGYTNEGQWLGAGIGTGGNSQNILFSLYYPRGENTLSFTRTNPDLDHVWFSSGGAEREIEIRVDLSASLSGKYWCTKNVSMLYDVSVTDAENYDYSPNSKSIHRYNVGLQFGAAYNY